MLNGSEMLNLHDLELGIEQARGFLQRSQLSSGEFKLLMSSDVRMEKDCVLDSSPFATALIAYSLSFDDSTQTKEILDKTVRFFLAEMEGPGLWRYWTKKHPYYAVIPPDLDDIACISSVLHRRGVDFPNNRKLLFSNRDSRGLFYTWLTPRWPLTRDADYRRVVLRQLANPVRFYLFWRMHESTPNDVDGVVNANMLFYMGESKATQPVIDYLIGIMQRHEEGSCDKWHHNRYTFYYAVSRNYYAGMSGFAPVRDTLVSRIVETIQADGAVNDNVLDTALAACALLNCRVEPPELAKAIGFLLSTQRVHGEWPAVPMYYAGPTNPAGFGSEELTTGFCLEALARYRLSHS